MAENNLTPEEVIEKLDAKFNEKLQGAATKDDVAMLKGELDSLKSLESKSQDMAVAIAKFEGKLEAMTEKSSTTKELLGTIGEQVVKGYKDSLESLKDGKAVTLDVKNTTITGDYTGNIALSVLEAGVNRIARKIIKIRNVVNTGTTTSKFVTYIQQTLQSTATFIGEGVQKVTGDLKYQEVSVEVKKVAGIIKISKEMLDDLDFVRNEVNTDLMATVEDQIENGILNGNGVGANLNGILNVAPTFTAGTFALQVPQANLADVIRVAVANIEAANFMATHVALNPVDVARLQLTKTTSGEYTYPIFYVDNLTGEPKVANLTVVSTNYMTAGNFLVGDMTKSNVRMRENMNIQVGYVNDDFERNMVSILCEARLVHYIKANDVNAFQKGVIATAITAINKP
jgi:HK97 family phage major capsid protein